MRRRYIYQLAATILPNGRGYDTVDHDLGIFTSLRTAKKVLRDYVKGGDFYCPVYSFSIMYLPVDNDCNGAWSKSLNIDLRAVIDIGPGKKPYFTLYNHWKRGLATKCARISFLEPKYELGSSYNKSVWFLDDNEKKMLMKFLKTKCRSIFSDKCTNNWMSVIGAFNNEVQGDDDSRILPYDLPIPNYNKLEP